VKDQLAHLEQIFEDFLENSVARIFGETNSAARIASQLARTMSDGIKRDESGRAYAPDQYALTLHPADADSLLVEIPGIQGQFSDVLVAAARENSLILNREPHITIAADPTLTGGQARVISWHSSAPLEFTQAMQKEAEQDPRSLPPGAYLIIDAGKHFPLDRAVINLGRRIDNQIILEDPHVSRTHAQIRAKQGQFVIFDVGSTTGTSVNGKRVTEHILRAGDVITIASVRLVYGEDPTGTSDVTPAYTPPFPPRPAGDQKTRTDRRPSENQE
jgi:hypothetical protein